MSNSLPTFNTDEEMIAFLDQEDLSDYIDHDHLVPARITSSLPAFEELPKTENVHIRFSKPLLEAVKTKAASQGVPYQKYIRRVIEISLNT